MKKYISSFILLVYGALLIKVMVFKDVPMINIGGIMLNFGGINGGNPPNFIPFKTIFPYLLGDKGWIIAGLNLFGNIIFLVPVGFLIPFVFQKFTWKKALLVAVLSGLIIEVMQFILRVGIFDIDDVILNGLGVMIGYCIYVIFARMRSTTSKIIFIGSLIALAGLSFFGITSYLKSQASANPRMNAERRAVRDNPSKKIENAEASENNDPCGGTGGTGKIIKKAAGTMTIERNDGVQETFNLSSKTTIKNSKGDIKESELKLGDHVTVVVFDSKNPTDVLVCSTSN